MNELQHQASNPEYSVWVSASAGTGKTKILTDRVLKLLISGVPFAKILCLTFTNAAAFEMQSRIRSKLANFAILPSQDLIKELTLLLARTPATHELQSAKTLYNKLLNSNQGISIYTIHAFCHSLLKLFAFEGGLQPQFEILDDITAAEILQKIKYQIYLNPEHHELINFFLTNFHEVTIDDILSEIIGHKGKFRKLFASNLANIGNFQEIFAQFSTISSLKQQQLQELYDKATTLLTQYEIDIEQEISCFFLTKDSAKRKNLLPKAIAVKYPELLPLLQSLQQEIFDSDQQWKTAEMKYYSATLKLLAQIFLEEYESYKAQHSLLDYEDLIYQSKLLLTNEKLQNWILYKQGGGTAHLLVDEAQDTSYEQWQIVTTIIADFYTNAKCSIFVVGDEKQSIFSFQGADITFFDSVKQQLHQNFSQGKQNFKDITLEWSYRSTAEIIDIVYITFEQIKNTTPQLFTSRNPKILPFRKNHQGLVEIWPLTPGKPARELFWPLPQEHNKADTPKAVLAAKIANFIKQQILTNKILPATNSPVTEADFMILVRKRDELVYEIISALKKYDLQVEDIDRVTLNQNLSVLDLMAIAKFVLLPQDDLNLASLLKSPIMALKEEELQQLAIARGKTPLWLYLARLPEYANCYEKLCYFLQIYKNSQYGAHCGKFFSVIVDCFNIRKILVENNGFDSNDLINELIYLSFNYAGKVDNLLQSFVYWFDNNTIEIKRNLETSSKIKIMTVHASKGLQAPIVILCDTTSLPVNTNKFIWDQEGEIYSTTQAASNPEFFKELKEQQNLKDMQEYIRLLYVAMTRAEDQLIICGYQPNKNLPQNCWYELILRAMTIAGKLDENGIRAYEITRRADNHRENQSVSVDGPNKAIVKLNEEKFQENKSPEDLLFDKILFNQVIKATKQNYSIKSPLTTFNHLEYGKIFHKILEDAAKINDFSYLPKHPFIKHLSALLQTKIYDNINKLLTNKEFMELNSEQLQPEATIGINLANQVKIGRIDLLAINPRRITIIDYKTDATPPKTTNLINVSYIDQLNFYRHMIQKLYPHKEVISKILWLENAHFMALTTPDELQN